MAVARDDQSRDALLQLDLTDHELVAVVIARCPVAGLHGRRVGVRRVDKQSGIDL